MPIDKLERLMWRLREYKTNKLTNKQFRQAIIKECGFDIKTYYSVKKALFTLGWIKIVKTRIHLTGKDIT